MHVYIYYIHKLCIFLQDTLLSFLSVLFFESLLYMLNILCLEIYDRILCHKFYMFDFLRDFVSLLFFSQTRNVSLRLDYIPNSIFSY